MPSTLLKAKEGAYIDRRSKAGRSWDPMIYGPYLTLSMMSLGKYEFSISINR